MSKQTSKVAIVTGAQQGIGRATALALAETGLSVIIIYLDDPDAAQAIAAATNRMTGMAMAAWATGFFTANSFGYGVSRESTPL